MINSSTFSFSFCALPQLISTADKTDYILMIVGTIGAMGNGEHLFLFLLP